MRNLTILFLLALGLGQNYSDWQYFKDIAITGFEDDIANYQLKIDFLTESNMNDDFSDLRFVDDNGNLLNHWIENNNAGSITVWIKIPFLLNEGSNLKLYYGNTLSNNISNPHSVFEIYEDFNNGFSNDWIISEQTGSSYQFNNGKLEINVTQTDNFISIDSNELFDFSSGYSFSCDVMTDQQRGHLFMGFGNGNSTERNNSGGYNQSNGFGLDQSHVDSYNCLFVNEGNKNTTPLNPNNINTYNFQINQFEDSYFECLVDNQVYTSGSDSQYLNTNTHPFYIWLNGWDNNNKSASIDNLIIRKYHPGSVSIEISNEIENQGCTDSVATNYDENAYLDDGSCEYPDNGDYSLSFDGDNDLVIVPDSPELTSSNELTISARFKKISETNEYIHNFMALIGKGSSDIDEEYTLMVGDKIYFDVGGSAPFLQEDYIFNLNEWYNLSAVHIRENDTSILKIYLNGVLLFSKEINYGSPNGANNFNLTIGMRNSEYPFNGNIDNLELWNTALSQEQIQSYMTTPPTGDENGLVAHYKFNAGEGETIYDHSGNGNHGMINGATWVENIAGCTDPYAQNYDQIANIDDGSCAYPDNGDYLLIFDGVDDWIEFNGILPINESYTINCWIERKGYEYAPIFWNGTLPNESSWIEIYTQPNSGGGSSDALTVAHNRHMEGYNGHYFPALLTNELIYLSIVYNSDTISVYYNGTLEEKRHVPLANNPLINNFYIGRLNSVLGEDFYLDGAISSFDIWNKSLNHNEIELLMSQQILENYYGLVAKYKFNAGTGNILYDHSGNGNHGTINGATWAGCTDPLAENYAQNAEIDDGSCTGSPVNQEDFIFGGEFNGNYYYLSHEQLSWNNAKLKCENNSGYLTTIANEEENTFVSDLSSEYLWIGLTDENSEDSWYWVTGEPFNYDNWGSAQPDNGGDGEHYVHINYTSTGQWNDHSNEISWAKRFVLEVELGCTDVSACNYDELATSDDGSCDYTTDLCGICVNAAGHNSSCQGCMQSEASNYNPDALIDDGSCSFTPPSTEFTFGSHFEGSDYYLSTNGASWQNANEICAQYGGHLATISSHEENIIVSNLSTDNSISIGLTDEISEGNWVWVTGEPLTYTNWDLGQPSNSSGGENYALIQNHMPNSIGTWNDVSGTGRYALEIEQSILVGCTDPIATNHSPEAEYDDASCEYNFNFEQSTVQAFYFFEEALIDGWPIEEGDQIVAYKSDSLGWPIGDPVGGGTWMGEYTDIVVMGDEGSEFTTNFLQEGDIPAFRIYASSIHRMYDARLSDGPFEFSPLGYHPVERIEVEMDCCGELGGHSVVDYCGDCIGSCTNFEFGENDSDGDLICDEEDNCIDTPNPDQENCDDDSLGNACDDDDDDDGCLDDDEPDAESQCLSSPDEDEDGLGNDCDPCPMDTENDADGDGICCGDGDPFCYDPLDDIDGDGLGCNVEGYPIEDLFCCDPENDADEDGLGCNTVEGCVDESSEIIDDYFGNNCCSDPNNDGDNDGVCGNPSGQDACLWGDDKVDSDGDGLPNDCDFSRLLTHSTLVSFWAIPEDNSLDNMLSQCDITAIISDSKAAITINDNWYGQLASEGIMKDEGYWLIRVSNDDCLYEIEGNYVNFENHITFELQKGNNLISYPFSIPQEISDIEYLCEDEIIIGIVGEGMAAMCDNGMFVGSLVEFEYGDGYWFRMLEYLENFGYPLPNIDNLARTADKLPMVPEEFRYNQSTQQAFYFIESIKNIEIGDWVLAYSGDKVIGAREWIGEIIDVPAMGDDSSEYTKGYIQTGSIPTFKLLQDGKLLELQGEIPAWSNNQLFMLASLSGKIALPETFSLDRAYPNPFNPVTTLHFALPIETDISMAIYNLQGRQVISLVNGNMNAGYHSVVWNADSHSSGVYFVKMIAGEYVNTHKLMLIK